MTGTLTMSGAPATNVDMGLQRSGDCNNDNLVTAPDFILIKNAFGKASGQVGYDNRGDINGDQLLTSPDFIQLKNNFGFGGAFSDNRDMARSPGSYSILEPTGLRLCPSPSDC
ncbi:MAG: dockerin type I domain-containing protein [Chloroflexia bacterium]